MVAYARRPITNGVASGNVASIQTIGNAPKVYWNGRHRVFFGKYKLNGKWKNKLVPVSIDDQDKATKWFSVWLRRLEDSGVEPVNDEVQIDHRKTMRSLSGQWLRWKKEQFANDEKSYKGCDRLLEKWVFPHAIADVDIENELDLGHCTEWVEWIKKTGKASNTVRNIVQGLRGFLVDVRGKGWVKVRENPLLDPYIRKVMGTVDTVAGKNTIIHLKKEEAITLLTCTAVDIPAVRKVRNLIAITTGLRMGEMAALRWEDIDLEAKVPTAKAFRQLTAIGRNGQKTFKDPKKKSHRIMPLHPSAAAALRWWKVKGWKEYVGRSPVESDPLFSTPNGDYSLSRWADLLRTDLAVAKLPTLFDGKHNITFHALRRTFMTLLEGEGVSRDLISALAGHSGRTVADRHYIAKNIDRFCEVVKQLPIPENLPWVPDSGPRPSR